MTQSVAVSREKTPHRRLQTAKRSTAARKIQSPARTEYCIGSELSNSEIQKAIPSAEVFTMQIKSREDRPKT